VPTTDKHLSDYLAAKGAAVVHLSHHAVMDRTRPIFPEDIHRAIAKRAEFNLSCVVVWPAHGMNLPGSVGVIFKPLCSNVVSVSNTDAGSTTLPDGSDGSAGFPLSAETLALTFEVWDAYNEWRVRGAEVVGIFVADPSNIEVKKRVVLKVDGHEIIEVVATCISLDEVFTAFPHHSIFSMGPAGMVELSRP
jgi:hypothetical protein